MAIVAAFLWNKKKNPSISTLIFDESNMKILSPPHIDYFAEDFFRFKNEVTKVIEHFFEKILSFNNNQKIVIEFKIVFNATQVYYLIPSPKSNFVYRTFKYFLHKTKQKSKNVHVNPQLRKQLSGRSLKLFHRQLRLLNLVSRKINTRFEYNLWGVALHATPKTFELRLKSIRQKLMDEFWKKES